MIRLDRIGSLILDSDTCILTVSVVPVKTALERLNWMKVGGGGGGTYIILLNNMFSFARLLILAKIKGQNQVVLI